MNLVVKQKFSLGYENFEIYNTTGETVYTAKGEFSWGGTIRLYNAAGEELGLIKGRPLSMLPQYDVYKGDTFLGSIKKKFSFFKARFDIDLNGWQAEGNFLELEYRIFSSDGSSVAVVSQKAFSWTDTYSLEIIREEDTVGVPLTVLAIDAEKASRQIG